MAWRLVTVRVGLQLRPWAILLLAGASALGCSAAPASQPGGSDGTGASGGTPPMSTGGAAPMPTFTAGGTPPVPTGTSAGGTPPVPTGTSAGGTPPVPTGDLPFAGYDPNVRFEWEETTPTAGSCEAGQYDGAFDGFYLSPIAVALPVPITGTVTHRLERAPSGEFFEIKDGRVEGTADTPIGPVPFQADFTGELNCADARLEGAFLRNGSYTNPLDGVVYPFEGPVEAMYDKLAHQFVNGTWMVGEPTWATPRPFYGGDGHWGSQWVGP